MLHSLVYTGFFCIRYAAIAEKCFQKHGQSCVRYSTLICVIVLVPQEVQKIQMCLNKSILVDRLLHNFNYDYLYSTTTDE